MDALLARAAEVYAFTYFGAVLALAVVEWAFPRRRAAGTMGTRWFGNIGVGVVDAVVLRLLFPAVGFAWAAICATRGWGVLNQTAAPVWIGVAVSIVALDFTAYAQHWLLHRVPLLWRMHVTHHSDREIDFTTGLRFHPLEAIFTTSARVGVIALLGLPPLGVVIAETMSLVVSFWEHSNTRVPRFLDRALRLLIVTPDVHRTHHSQDGPDNHSNFGTISTCWDRLFGTYRDQPARGSEHLVAGLRGYEDRKHSTLRWILAHPFVTVGEPETQDAPEAAKGSTVVTR
jgi:sterol desaturase/sphingolipid hydroxylase (fatty acid hydroxylase superfamily)